MSSSIHPPKEPIYCRTVETFLGLIVVALLVLENFSKQLRLHQQAFTYETGLGLGLEQQSKQVGIVIGCLFFGRS